jgi:hypothetical protein
MNRVIYSLNGSQLFIYFENETAFNFMKENNLILIQNENVRKSILV